MRKSKLMTLLAAASFAVIASSAMVYASDSDGSSSSMMGRGGMMGRGMMGGGGMAGRTSQMMGHCGSMMQSDRGSGRPNEQWRDGKSPAPDDNN